MNRSLILLVGLTSLLPLGLEVPGGDDSTSTGRPSGTRLRVAGGAGYYAFIARGCEGEVLEELPVHFRDGSVSLEHRFAEAPVSLGVRGGWIRDRIDTSSSTRFASVPAGQTLHNRYMNPFVELDPGDAAIGVGVVFHDEEFLTTGELARASRAHQVNDVSFHFRIGRLERRHLLVQWMESEPLYSGGGYLTIGLGGQTPDGRLHAYGGLSAGGPYEGAGLMLRGSFGIAAGTRVHFGGRLSASGSSPAYGGSMGFEFNVPAGASWP